MSDTTSTTPIVKEEIQANEQQPKADVSESKRSEPNTSTEEMFTKAQIQEMLTKARQEEKAKLYKSIEKAKAEATDTQAERDKVLQELSQAKERLQTLQDSNMSDIEKVNRQIELLAQQNELLKQQMEQVSKQAEERVRVSEVSAYRQKKVESSGLLFPEMVTGNTPEEIDASIEQLKLREESVRTQLEDKMRSEQAINVPRPMSPDATTPSTSSRDRYQISKMNRDEYSAIRQKLMAQALDSVRR